MQKSTYRLYVQNFLSFLCGAGATYLAISNLKSEHNIFNLSPNQIEVCFTFPKSYRDLGKFVECEPQIIKYINSATKSIYVQAYSFTSDKITNALVEAHKRGVKVSIILDKENESRPYPAIHKLFDNNIDIKIRRISGISHNKIMIIDEQVVITGSYNFTKAANEKNDENILIICNKDIASKYKDNWLKCHSHTFEFNAGAKTSPTPWDNPVPIISATHKKATNLLEILNHTNRSVYVLATNKLPEDVLYALLKTYATGKDVRILANNKNALHGLDKQFRKLKQYNIVPKYDRSYTQYKSTVLIIDNSIKVTLGNSKDTDNIDRSALVTNQAKYFERVWASLK